VAGLSWFDPTAQTVQPLAGSFSPQRDEEENGKKENLWVEMKAV